jgi:hypothetical protein
LPVVDCAPTAAAFAAVGSIKAAVSASGLRRIPILRLQTLSTILAKLRPEPAGSPPPALLASVGSALAALECRDQEKLPLD